MGTIETNEVQQVNNVPEIWNRAVQAATGVLSAAMRIAHAPEYTDVKATMELNLHKVTDEGGKTRLDIGQEVKLFIDGEFVAPEEVEEIFKTNKKLLELEAQAQEMQKQLMQQRMEQMQGQNQKQLIKGIDPATARRLLRKPN